MAQVLRLYIQMFLSYRLHICIILKTAHHRTTFGIFCNITQNITPEENSCKMFHTPSPIVLFFLWEGQGCFLDKDQVSYGKEQKERVRGGMGEEPQVRVIFAKFPLIKQDTTFISQTVGQTNF